MAGFVGPPRRDRDRHLTELFADDPARGTELALTVGDLYIDYSKHRVTRRTLDLLVDLARAAGLEERRDAMFAGEHINTSEDRAVLHTALRLPRDAKLVVDGQDVVADVHDVLDRMGDFTDRLRSGEWTGATGERITTVVNIGIGGSDLGPVMVYDALRHYADAGISARFVSNVDPADLVAKLDGLEPAKTLFIVASKTFSTLETLTNATAARRWLTDAWVTPRWPSISSRCPPTRSWSTSSASTPTTCSGSGTGWAGATRWTVRSG